MKHLNKTSLHSSLNSLINLKVTPLITSCLNILFSHATERDQALHKHIAKHSALIIQFCISDSCSRDTYTLTQYIIRISAMFMPLIFSHSSLLRENTHIYTKNIAVSR
jgi:hypothetical protein